MVKSWCRAANQAARSLSDNSLVLKKGEDGHIDRIFKSTTPNGYQLIKVVIRKSRIPEIGDKFACFSPDTEVLTRKGWKKIKRCNLQRQGSLFTK